jgi:phosphatidylethanolamine/phosphatidyl-N-methylethanolamine N-methyltransferase
MSHVNTTSESELFFRQWLRSPKSMGSVVPSSSFLARGVAECVEWRPGQTVVELGGGTGAVTDGLINSGIPREALVVIELDKSLARYLRDRLPGVNVVQGNATRLAEVLEPLDVGEISTVISGLPMLTMPIDFQRAILESSFSAMGSHGFVVQYTYSPIAPIPARKLGVSAKLKRVIVRNVPPATIWTFQPRRMNGKANGHI